MGEFNLKSRTPCSAVIGIGPIKSIPEKKILLYFLMHMETQLGTKSRKTQTGNKNKANNAMPPEMT